MLVTSIQINDGFLLFDTTPRHNNGGEIRIYFAELVIYASSLLNSIYNVDASISDEEEYKKTI